MIGVRRLSELDPLTRRALLTRTGVVTPDLLAAVRLIVEDVRDHGDSAVRAYAEKFDKVRLEALEVPRAELEAAAGELTPAQRSAIDEAHRNVTEFHRNLAGLLQDADLVSARPGIRMGRRQVPFDRAGLYVPGGLASYPTTVLMNAVPPREAGVRDVVLCTPAGPDGRVNAAVRYAALVTGLTRIFRIGGAQAIAAMAYGTETIPRVEIIVGPGNRFVTAAKKVVSGDVAIDFLAGPTELLVLSDGTGEPAFLASDLIAQAEHDPAACVLLVTTDAAQAAAVAVELEKQVVHRERKEIIRNALTRHGALLVADSLDQALAFANEYGPEHLSIVVREPEKALPRVRHAGAVFLGEWTPVATGDYCTGPNSTLPTLGGARLTSGLSVNTFLKSITWQHLTREGLESLASMATTLAKLESLEGHLASIEIRRGRHGA